MYRFREFLKYSLSINYKSYYSYKFKNEKYGKLFQVIFYLLLFYFCVMYMLRELFFVYYSFFFLHFC